jgi:hypothetical protein
MTITPASGPMMPLSSRTLNITLQRLKAQGLWRRVEGQSRLAQERVDEVGPSLDLPEPGADDGFVCPDIGRVTNVGRFFAGLRLRYVSEHAG